MQELSDKSNLGKLALDLGLIKVKDLHDALSIAKETSLPLGRILIMSNLLSENSLTNVLRCQTLLKEGLVDQEMARKAMDKAELEQLNFEEALYKLGWTPQSGKDLTPLGELLVKANFVTKDQLKAALDKHKNTGLPFGRVLVLGGSITEGLLSAAVNAQILVRDGRLTQEQAVVALKEVRRREVPFEVSIKEKGFYDLPSRNCPKLGELLLLAGVISQSELITALETGLINKKPVGEVLVELKFLSREILEAALKMQNMISEERITISDARVVLNGITDGKSFEDAFKQIDTTKLESSAAPSLSLVDFLRLMKVLEEDEIEQAWAIAQHNSQIIAQVLLLGGVSDEAVLKQAEICRKLVQNKDLDLEHASIIFDYARRRAITVDEALQELHWQRAEKVSDGLKSIEQTEPDTREQWSNLRAMAEQFTAQRDYRKALHAWQHLMDSLPQRDERYVETLDAMASLHILQQDFEDAEAIYQQALQSKKDLYGAGSMQVAVATSNLGKIAYFQRKYDDAADFTHRYINICAANLGEDHPNVACGWQNLATIYHVQGRFTSAEDAYTRAIRICTVTLGEQHPTTQRSKKNYASLLHAKNERAGLAEDAATVGKISGSWRAISLTEAERLLR